jgi:hypothetical protein
MTKVGNTFGEIIHQTEESHLKMGLRRLTNHTLICLSMVLAILETPVLDMRMVMDLKGRMETLNFFFILSFFVKSTSIIRWFMLLTSVLTRYARG